MTCVRHIVLLLVTASIASATVKNIPKGTFERIKSYGYAVESHTVRTSDGYILTLFRIPHSQEKSSAKIKNKPVIYLQHGLLSSSDCWILNGRENSLAFMLADAGFDVWLGNARGNTYSRKHSTLSPATQAFWHFSWHELGIYDLPASIDYILKTTKQSALHYVGHSQGTTTFMVMLSLLPDYNAKIKTSHMLAPVVYNNHMQSPLAKALGPLLGVPSLLSLLMGDHEFMPSIQLLNMLGSVACKNKSPFQQICSNILFLIGGWDSQHLNYTALPEIFETHPAGVSSSQIVHYLQEYLSGDFRQYDHGIFTNLNLYGQFSPPSYPVANIRPKKAIQFYYSDNDYFAATVDVLRFAKILGSKVHLNHIKYKDWNHLDFLWAMEVKEEINERIIRRVDKYENSI